MHAAHVSGCDDTRERRPQSQWGDVSASERDAPTGSGKRRAAWGALVWAGACGPVTATLLDQLHSGWIAMLAYHAGCTFVSVRLASFGRRPPWGGLCISALGTTAIVVGVGAWLVPVLGGSHLEMTRWNAWGLRAPGDFGLLAYFVVANASVEEALWRGALLGPEVRALLGERTSWAASVLLFALFHLWVLGPAFDTGVAVGASLLVGLAAAAWSVLRRITDGIWWGICTHQGVNLALAILYFWFLRES